MEPPGLEEQISAVEAAVESFVQSETHSHGPHAGNIPNATDRREAEALKAAIATLRKLL